MLRPYGIGLVLALGLANLAGAAPALERPDPVKFRQLAEAKPAAALADGRRWLDAGRLSGDPAGEREILRAMGRAALLLSDDVAVAEVALRLESLGQSGEDVLAPAYAGFLRAQRMQQQGHQREALAETLRAAERLQDNPDPAIVAIADFHRCDAYVSTEEYERALPLCESARKRWHDANDRYGEARALNLEALVRFYLDDKATAIADFEQARQAFRALGETAWVASVGDNLGRAYIDGGRAEEGLELARDALRQDRLAGRAVYADMARANIARALSALGRHREALAEITAAVEDLRHENQPGALPDLLDTQSRIAETAGDLALALKSLRESVDFDGNERKVGSGAAVADLEARFASREKELRIRDLERENRIKQLELTAERADAAVRDAALTRQRLVLLFGGIAVVALVTIVALLGLLLRSQRRHTAELGEQALRDPLTGIENRRALFARMRALEAGEGLPPPHALLLLDLDHFKQINDRHGHPAGDAVLAAVARRLKQALGARGTVARLGGEEFAALCPGCDRAEAIALAEQLRFAVAALDVPNIGERVPVSASLGVALFESGQDNLDDWMRAADRALYAAKAQGRNRVVDAATVRGEAAMARRRDSAETE